MPLEQREAVARAARGRRRCRPRQPASTPMRVQDRHRARPSSPSSAASASPSAQRRSAASQVEARPWPSPRAARARAPRACRSPSARKIASASAPSAIDVLVRNARRISSAPAATQRPRPLGRRLRRRGERAREPARALDEVARGHPERPQRARQPQRPLRVVAERRGERGAQVVVLGLEALGRPHGATPGSASRSAASASSRYKARWRGLEALALAGLGKALARVLAHRLEQPVAVARGVLARPGPATCRRAARAGRAPRRRSARRRTQIALDRLDAKLPANTPRRRKSARSGSVSRSWLQASVARSVCWRVEPRPAAAAAAARARRPGARRSAPARAPPRAPRRARARAACRPAGGQISATAAALSSVSAKPGAASAARWQNRRIASKRSSSASGSPPASGSDSDGTRQATSPGMRRGSRLVARTCRFGQARSSRSASARAGLDQVLAVVEHEQQVPVADLPRERVDRVALGAQLQPERGGRLLGHRAPGRRPARARRARRRRRVVLAARRPARARGASCPQPPGPVSVSRRVRSSSRASSASSRSRPTKLVSWCGSRGRGRRGCARGGRASASGSWVRLPASSR